MAGIAINVGGDLRAVGKPITRPFPSLSGKLFAAHLFGVKYAAKARLTEAAALGSRYDWSENGRHLSTLGQAAIGNFGFQASVGLVAPKTSFTLDQVAGEGDAFTIVSFLRSTTASKSISIARTSGAAPIEAQLASFPGAASGGRVEANQTAGATTSTASVTGISSSFSAGFCLYASAFSVAKRAVFFKSPSGAVLTSETVADLALSSSDVFEFGVEAENAAQTGQNDIPGVAFYTGYLTAADLITIQTTFRAFSIAAAATITV